MVSKTSPFRATGSTAEEQAFVLDGIRWDSYVGLNDLLGERPGIRVVYCEGRLTIVTTSRRHDWYAERLGILVAFVADGLNIAWEDSGSATYRRRDRGSGVEGDKTFYFGSHAGVMKGAVEIDLATQPPPDLAIEIEVTHSADEALAAWGRLGVPEVWRFDPDASHFAFLLRQKDRSYAPSERSLAFPALAVADVLEQMRLADSMGAGPWFAQLRDWVRDVLAPRVGPGAG